MPIDIRLLLAALVCVVAASPSSAADPFAENVRTTPPLSPEDERVGFTVPPGFVVQLFAAEPEIAKPLNMAFDDRGRLWVADTLEYPFAAPLNRPGRDSIKVLEDTDGDGRAEKVTTFADGLNIPIGIYPHGDGATAFSIPHIWRLRDTDCDGRCDKREVLFGPFDHTRDTHGLNNAFRRGYDGWVYACHGYNNHSRVKGRDGHVLDVHSGNTYRFRLDGSRIEQFTWGQVNPFGMAIDQRGNLFTADCHSKPVYQLLRGGHYPSFGKPDDGLGFVPPMMDHSHGSTAICGIAVAEDDRLPPEFRGHIVSGNVMTSRVNRNALEYRGSTIVAKEQPDFIVAKDPWFRPVDIVLGPDGAIYVADFYNRIIGHYEVDLRHPGRDRHRGRIWRIAYVGDGKDSRGGSARKAPDLTRLTTDALLQTLGDSNTTLALLALHRLVDHVGAAAAQPLRKAATSNSPRQRRMALWGLQQFDAATEAQLLAAGEDIDSLARTHALKVFAETKIWSPAMRAAVHKALADADGFVARAAADAIGRHPDPSQVKLLLAALQRAPAQDNHLAHTIRMALRDQLHSDETLANLRPNELSPKDAQTVLALAAAIPKSAAAMFLIASMERDGAISMQPQHVLHAARFAAAEQLPRLVELVRKRSGSDWTAQLSGLSALRVGLEQRGAAPPAALRDWAAALVGDLLAGVDQSALAWTNSPVEGKRRSDDPWVVQPRASSDGDSRALFFGSLPRGEQLTGTLRSQAFALPRELTFFVAGHCGFPTQKDHGQNRVRLRDAQSGAVLRETSPPRNDVAQRVAWDLREHAGRQAVIEIVDGDEGTAFAWLAVGRFSHAALNPSPTSQRLQTAADLIAAWKLVELKPRLAKLLTSDKSDPATQAAIVKSLAALAPDRRVTALAALLGETSVGTETRRLVHAAVLSRDSGELAKALAAALREVPERLHLVAAETLAGEGQGAAALLDVVAQGAMSARMLVRPSVRERLAALRDDAIRRRAAELTADLPAENATLNNLIVSRRRSYARAAATASIERGAAVFTKHCANCHQIAGRGVVVGPQLDGIGNRGLERLLEDVLDPNRNVDVAFRTTGLALQDGTLLNGLLRREAGATLVLADDKGKEFTVPKDQIERQSKSMLSLMPANVGETLPEGELYDLMAYLLTQRQMVETKP